MTEKGESNVKVDARDQKKIQFQCSISYEVLCRRFLWSDVQSKIFYTVNPLLQFFFDINQWIRMICIQFQGNIIIFSFHHFFLSRPPSNQHQVEFVYFFFLIRCFGMNSTTVSYIWCSHMCWDCIQSSWVVRNA